jgi:hypothetical protein
VLTRLGRWFNDPIPEYGCASAELPRRHPIAIRWPGLETVATSARTHDTCFAHKKVVVRRCNRGNGVKVLRALQQFSARVGAVA